MNKESRNQRRREEESPFKDRVVYINRVAKVVKGGRRFSFSALVVVGDEAGQLGYALGKANEVPEAIRKATEKARRNMVTIPVVDATIPYEALGKYGAGRVLLRPASPGTGVIAGGPVRAVMEVAGIHNILTKCLGTRNPHNVIHATFDALSQLATPEQTAKRRGKSVDDLSLSV